MHILSHTAWKRGFEPSKKFIDSCQPCRHVDAVNRGCDACLLLTPSWIVPLTLTEGTVDVKIGTSSEPVGSKACRCRVQDAVLGMQLVGSDGACCGFISRDCSLLTFTPTPSRNRAQTRLMSRLVWDVLQGLRRGVCPVATAHQPADSAISIQGFSFARADVVLTIRGVQNL